jgi:hypothetical protein
MDAPIEPLIELFLTRGGKVFIASQYDIPYDPENADGGTCPDFVALDFGKREILIVEVSGGADIRDLIKRVRDRDKRWFEPLKRRYKEEWNVLSEWNMRFLGFVREPNLAKLRKIFEGVDRVSFYAIEDATFPYKYWNFRLDNGLPR